MRLNFSGVSDEEIREGVRRIGKAIAEQVELYRALTVNPAASSAPAQPQESDMDASELPRPGAAGAEEKDDGAGGDVLPFRREEAG
jgi:hypothetical protein